MRCPFCKQDNDKVIDSRSSGEGVMIRRRRECLDCKRRYTTYERIEEFPIRVIKKDGTQMSFQRDKLIGGILRACEKRPVSLNDVEQIIDEMEQEINERFDREVNTNYIGEFVMRRLQKLDAVAYVRFASVYREFKDISEFLEEVKPMIEKLERGR